MDKYPYCSMKSQKASMGIMKKMVRRTFLHYNCEIGMDNIWNMYFTLNHFTFVQLTFFGAIIWKSHQDGKELIFHELLSF